MADQRWCLKVLAKVFEISSTQFNFRSNFTNKGDARIARIALKRLRYALADLLLARTPAGIDFDIVHRAGGHSMTFRLNAAILLDRGNHSAALAARPRHGQRRRDRRQQQLGAGGPANHDRQTARGQRSTYPLLRRQHLA